MLDNSDEIKLKHVFIANDLRGETMLDSPFSHTRNFFSSNFYFKKLDRDELPIYRIMKQNK